MTTEENRDCAVSSSRGVSSPCLEVFDATEHVQVSSRVLLDHVLDVIRPQRFLEALLVQQELHDPVTATGSM